MRTLILPLWAFPIALVCLAPARAEHLGAIGPVYPIAEEDFLAMIERRLTAQDASGALSRAREHMTARARQAVLQPIALPLPAASVARSWHVDPTYVLPHDVRGADGRLLFAAGTRANPLDIVSLVRPLLLFDGRDARQVTLARRTLGRYAGNVKPVLTGGSYIDLMRRWRVPVYYDQQGRLVARLGIARVPALVTQDGRQLRVDELVPPALPAGAGEDAP